MSLQNLKVDAFAPNRCFSREAGYITANQTMPMKQAQKKLVLGL